MLVLDKTASIKPNVGPKALKGAITMQSASSNTNVYRLLRERSPGLNASALLQQAIIL